MTDIADGGDGNGMEGLPRIVANLSRGTASTFDNP
jgi:hypothetical protein